MAKRGRKPGTPDRFGPKTRERFLAALAELGSFRAACGRVDISYRVALLYRKAHPDFDQQCTDARMRTRSEVTSQLRRLVLDGVVEPIFDRNGVQIGERRRYSEKLLLAWLRKLESGSWLERGRLEHKHSGSVQHEHSGRIQVEQMSAEQQRAARDFIRTLAVEPSAAEQN